MDPGTEAFNPRPLIPYLASLGIPYHYLNTPIMDTAAAGSMKGDSICAFCARMKRGALYTCCRENGYDVLVLGQHLDDLAESFVMSAFFNGKLRTMKVRVRRRATRSLSSGCTRGCVRSRMWWRPLSVVFVGCTLHHWLDVGDVFWASRRHTPSTRATSD